MDAYLRNALWILLRYGDPGDVDPAENPAQHHYGRGWRDGVYAAAKALGIDPEEFERLNALNAFTEQGIPCAEYDEWAARRAAEADEEEANRFA